MKTTFSKRYLFLSLLMVQWIVVHPLFANEAAKRQYNPTAKISVGGVVLPSTGTPMMF